MVLSDESLEHFVCWLCEHPADAPVGRAGMCFLSPLALWLSAYSGVLYGVDDVSYGPACRDAWKTLPSWARRFHGLLAARFTMAVTAAEVVTILAMVELS